MKIIFVEDDLQQRKLIEELLLAENFDVKSASTLSEAKLLCKKQNFDVVFSDWQLGDGTGTEFLIYIRQTFPDAGFVMATAYGTITHAIEAIRLGADDYLTKPFQKQELLLALTKAYNAHRLKKQNRLLSTQLSHQTQLVNLIGHAPCMQKVFSRIERVAATHATVLISGESGTGKELAARALHELSPRKPQNFIALNCGAIPESLAEVELFGAEKGAYTGANQTKIGKLEAASEGTLFLDEIGELPLSLQPKLLRFLQEGVINRIGSHQELTLDVRVIAATHKNLPEAVQQQKFRQDLYYRLNVVPISMPALRERKEDLPQLIEHLVNKFSLQYHIENFQFSRMVLKKMLDYSWPGNVRELSNLIERSLLMNDENELLEQLRAQPQFVQDTFTLPSEGIDWENFESHALKQALNVNQGNKTKAAQWLNLSYKAFLYRLEKHQIK
ncbi:MAG: sigma-54 dependent transcriptional regulator [Pseudomonadota bacterium]